ncbi:MAG: CRISPR-associated helicase Cas3' [Candidatus Kapabacteria bacterium]|nr:CRISPR-associated helicase Cas3' [Ignavibacteriota bacterium]MCW5883403.1 CRISPR-associated helicase Cas3' [Candidatus Kapabacteria bacterium]
MTDISNILAKSVEYGSVTLLDHTIQVANAALYFAENFDYEFDKEAVIYGAIIHDLGKAHPYFQKAISADKNDDFDFTEYKHRHEISSLAFLPAIPNQYWDRVIDMVVAHHKPIENDIRKRGILDIKTNDRYFIDNHLEDWENWKMFGIEILNHFGLKIIDISYDDAKKSINYTVNYCRNKQNSPSFYRGLLKAADHFASAFSFSTKQYLNYTFYKPSLNKYFDDKRKSELFPLSVVDVNDNRKHTLVVAPTGAGKTDFLMKRTQGRVFYTLPFQASINAMWQRFKEFDPDNPDIRLLHSTSKVIAGNTVEEQILQPLVGSSIKVLTPHQLAAIIFGTSGYESVMLDLKGCDVILDEIHTYSDVSRSMVIEIVKMLKLLECRIHIGTATMPYALYEHLLEILGGKDNVFEVCLSKKQIETFDRHLITKYKDKDLTNNIIEQSVNNNEKLLIVVNTVKEAQNLFKEIENQFPDIPKMLIHSRFRRKDREYLEKELKDKYDGGYNCEGLKPCIVISTQVVEVSLDISFDRMITQAAPIDSLIQRFGRVNRRRNISALDELSRTYKPIHIFLDEESTLPYPKDTVFNSYDVLPDNLSLLKESEIQGLIDKVYPEFDIKKIDMHLIFRNGNFVLKELTDNKKSVLIELLEIEGAVCILESDRNNYINANHFDKIKYEIPVSLKSVLYSKNKYEQLKVGSYPFVIPQLEEEHLKYGLEMKEISNII